MAHDRVLLDVAEAVASSEGVDWDRARRATRFDQRWVVDNLRALSRVFAGAGPESLDRSRAARGDPVGTAFVRLAFGALVGVAALQVATALVWIAWEWDRTLRAPFAVPRVLAFVCFLVCAVVLLIGGRLDRRARMMGAVFLVSASSFWEPFVVWILPETLQPALMWAFARGFPRTARRARFDDMAHLAVPTSAAIGGGLWIANLPPVLEWLPFLSRQADIAVYWTLLSLLTLSALAAIAWRARDAIGDESRRARLLIGGIMIGVAPMVLDIIVETLSPAARQFGDDHRAVIVAVVFTSLLSTPFTITWAVLVERALDVRLVVRASYRRLLTQRLLAAAITAPAVALGWMFVSQPDRTVEAVLAALPARLSVAVFCAAGLAAVYRRRLLVRLDAWAFPETQDHGRLLGAAGSELVQTTSVSQVGAVVAETARRACGARATMMTLSETADVFTGQATAPTAVAPPLSRTSAVAFMLESTREPINVDRHDPASAFHLLPAYDARWLVATETAIVAPVPGPGTELEGVLAVGRRFDDRRLSPVALEFLRTLGVTAGLALARLRSAASSSGRRLDAPAARECPVCGVVAEAAPWGAGGRPAAECECRVDYVQAPVPKVLVGKFRLERRLGSGGMGVVYLARDVDLHRHVAVKTLPSAAVQGLLRLRQEGRAMAAMAHPAIAQIHGVETWRGRPLLVVEYLAGGTLAARLGRGPVPSVQAMAVAVTVAEALGALHDAGYVHGDVKPSNVGFASDGTVKLLDFGLSRLADDGDGPTGGTLPYLSPEVLRGGRAGGADDVWALCVVLFEMLTGTRPFAGGSADELADRIRRQQIRRPPPESAGRRAHSFVVATLTAAASGRPASARAFADALRRL